MEKPAKWEFFKGTRDNWFSHPIYNWMDPQEFKEYKILHERCRPELVRQVLAPFLNIMAMTIRFYEEGTYQEPGKPLLTNVPAFYLIRFKQILSDRHTANIKLFLPLKWNERFMGIAGAGSNLETDWDKEQTTNLTSWPMAVRNGFACVVNDGATGMFVDATWGFKADHSLEWDMIEHWAYSGTHVVTQAARKVVEAVYDQPIYKSYMHGTSGGARQIMAEAQRYPQDYDGLWADGPLFDYYNMMFSCLWAALVYFNEDHKVSLVKYQAVKNYARSHADELSGSFDMAEESWQRFLRQIRHLYTSDGPINEEDLRVMVKVWNGPVLSDETRITYGFGPEITQWPVGPRQFGYLRIKENGEPSLIPFALQLFRWMVRDPEWDFRTCTYAQFEELYWAHKSEFEKYSTYETDLRQMAGRNGKLIITHGTGDHIVPNRLSLEYYKKASAYFSSEEEMKKYIRIFFPRFGGHALYDWDGPNVTNASGFRALMAWVEQDQAPEYLETLNYDFMKDQVIREGRVEVYSMT